MSSSKREVVAVAAGVVAATGAAFALRRYLRSSSGAEKPADLAAKFAPRDGLTFYFFPRSPCARRVWLTLIEKGIEFAAVEVNLMCGEQRSKEYLAINPQGKVPAIVVRNHALLPDCTLFESMAICEWLDEAFPNSTRLYPVELEQRFDVQQWQQWELGLAEEVWPLSRQQLDGAVWRFAWSRRGFFARGPVKAARKAGDEFYAQKVTKVYEGTFLSVASCRSRVRRILQALKTVDCAALESGTGGAAFLVGDRFSQADFAAYPRLVKMPQNGIAGSWRDRAPFEHAIQLFERLRVRPCFAQFVQRDLAIWNSGSAPLFLAETSPRFSLLWWGSKLPWWAFVALGKWRAGASNFERVTQASLETPPGDNGAQGEPTSALGAALREVETLPLRAVPGVRLDLAAEDAGTLYYDISDALCCSTIAALEEMGEPFRAVRVDTSLNEHLYSSHEVRALSPFGELPAYVCASRDGARALYGARVIVEYCDAKRHGDTWCRTCDAHAGLTPKSAKERAEARRWAGWARTAWFYQLQPLRTHLLHAPLLREAFDGSVSKFTQHLCRDVFMGGVSDARGQADAASEMLEAFSEPRTAVEMAPYAVELWARVAQVEAALRESGGAKGVFLVGDQLSSADAHALPVVALASLYARRCFKEGAFVEVERFGRVSDTRFVGTATAYTDERGALWSSEGWLLVCAEFPLVAKWAASMPASFDAACSDLFLAHNAPTAPAPLLSPVGMAHSLHRAADRREPPVRGAVVPHPPCVRPDVVRELRRRLVPKANDVWVCTYSKCGTTWMQQIVLLLLHEGDASRVRPHPALQKQAPWLEACYARSGRFKGPCPFLDQQSLKSPYNDAQFRHGGRRVFKTHAPFALFPVNPKAWQECGSTVKVVYVARNPKDVACSLYAHCKAIPSFEYEGDFDHFLKEFLKGRVEFGNWRDHHLAWFHAAQLDQRIHFVHFESLKTDPKAEIAKLYGFLFDALPETIPLDLLDAVHAASSFDAMKQASQNSGDTSIEATSRFRSGGAGKWHVDSGGMITDEHSAAIDEAFLKDLPAGLVFAGC